MSRVYAVLAVLAIGSTLLGGAYYKGSVDGKASEQAAQLEAVSLLNSALRTKQAQLNALEAQRLADMEVLEQQVNTLRSQAHEDLNANRPALGFNSVHRLNAVR